MNLLLGACAGYPAYRVRHFLESLRRWYDGEAAFVTASLPPDTKALLARHHVMEVPIEIPPPHTSIQSLRFPAYRDILLARPDVSRVFVSDVRDVWFQADPFPALPDGALIAFLEDRAIGACKFNRSWVATAYGAERLAEIGARPISCSGTVAGTRDGMLRYLDFMAREIARAGETGLQRGIDQGMHNHLLAGDLHDAVLVANRSGAVQTLHYQTEFCFDRGGRLVNRDGTVCPVIHQFDRFPHFAALLGIPLEAYAQR